MEVHGQEPRQLQPGSPEPAQGKTAENLHARLGETEHDITNLKGMLSGSKGEGVASKVDWVMNKIGIGYIGREIVLKKLERTYVKLKIAVKGDKASPTTPEKLPEPVSDAKAVANAEPKRIHPLPPHLRPPKSIETPPPPPQPDYEIPKALLNSPKQTRRRLGLKREEKVTISVAITRLSKGGLPSGSGDLAALKDKLVQVEGEIKGLEAHLASLDERNAPSKSPPPPLPPRDDELPVAKKRPLPLAPGKAPSPPPPIQQNQGAPRLNKGPPPLPSGGVQKK